MPGNFYTPEPTIFLTWPKPNYVDPYDRKWLMAYAIVWAIASTLLSFGRFYLRARKQAGTFGIDDVLIFFAWLFGIGMSIVACIGSYNGLGRHSWDIPIQKYPLLIEMGYFAQVFFLVSMCTTKLSVLLFYRRMVKDTYSHRWIYIIWAAISFNVSAGVATFIVYMAICRPLNSYWLAYQYAPTRYDQPYTCIAHGEGLTLSSCIISIITDLYAVAIPYLMLKQYNLDVPLRQKIALNFIFALGWLATGCGIARTYYLWKMGHVNDLSWTGFDLMAWSLAECHIGIICACAPSMRAFFRKYVNLSSHRSSRRVSRRAGDGGEDGCMSPSNRDSTRSILQMRDVKHDTGSSYHTTAPLPVMEKDDTTNIGVSETRSSSSHASK